MNAMTAEDAGNEIAVILEDLLCCSYLVIADGFTSSL